MLPGFRRTLGSTLLLYSLLILLPFVALAVKTAELTPRQIWDILVDPRSLATYRLTFSAAILATVADLVLGYWTAWILVKYEFPGRRLLDAVVDLPFALPTAVAGISLAALTAPNGWIGQFFAPHGIKVAYAFPGIVLAMTFTSFPFVVRAVQPVLADLDPSHGEACATLGAGVWRTFYHAAFLPSMPALLSGTGLAFVRSLGEFGAIVFIAGNLPFRTEVTSLLIFIRVSEFEYGRASVLATAVLTFALVFLLATNLLQHRLHRRLHGK